MYLLSAFSINMLNMKQTNNVYFKEVDKEFVLECLEDGFESYIGHEVTAEVLSEILGVHVEFNRDNVRLLDGDMAIVCQLPRPGEGQVYTQEELEALSVTFIIVDVSMERMSG